MPPRLLTRVSLPARDREGSEGSLALLAAGVVGAVWAAGMGLLAVAIPVVCTWATDPHSASSFPDALRTAGQVWLAAHGVSLALPTGSYGLTPLGLTVLAGVLLARTGRVLVRAYAVTSWSRLVGAAPAVALPYALLAALVAGWSGTRVAHPAPWQAFGWALVLSTVVTGGVAAHEADMLRFGGTPARVRAQVRSVAGALGVLVAAGALLVSVSLAAHMARATAVWDALGADLVGGALLFLLSVAFLPNAVLWATGFCVGPGFAVGAGTRVSAFGVHLGDVPSFPLLAGLPHGPLPAAWAAVLAVPVAAGVVAGLVGERAVPSPAARVAAGWGALAGVWTGCLVLVLAWVSGGPVDGGRLAVVGYSPWWCGLAAAGEVALGASLAAAVRARWFGGR